MSDDNLQLEIERLRAENEALKKKRNTSVSMKVSEKGAVSVYGLGRFPVTLYHAAQAATPVPLLHLQMCLTLNN
jgi:hypothetical protein